MSDIRPACNFYFVARLRGNRGRTSGERGKPAPGVLHGQLLRPDHGQGREGASLSLQGPHLETVEQRNGNFREIRGGRAPEKFSAGTSARWSDQRGPQSSRRITGGDLLIFTHRGALLELTGPGMASRMSTEGPSASYRLKDGQRRRINGRALFSVKYHDGNRAPQPPLSTPPGRL